MLSALHKKEENPRPLPQFFLSKTLFLSVVWVCFTAIKNAVAWAPGQRFFPTLLFRYNIIEPHPLVCSCHAECFFFANGDFSRNGGTIRGRMHQPCDVNTNELLWWVKYSLSLPFFVLFHYSRRNRYIILANEPLIYQTDNYFVF